MHMDAFLLKVAIFVVLFSIGWGFGRHTERKHFQALKEQENRLAYIHIETNRFKTSETTGQLVSSNVVISHDYFKYVIANIHNFFGGRLTSYESIVERARREAVIRLKLEAEKMGADPNCAFMLEARKGFYFIESFEGDYIKQISSVDMKGETKYTLATHGYSPRKPDYTTFFMAAGKGINKGQLIPHMNLVDIGPTLAAMLGVTLGETDGKVIEAFIQPNTKGGRR